MALSVPIPQQDLQPVGYVTEVIDRDRGLRVTFTREGLDRDQLDLSHAGYPLHAPGVVQVDIDLNTAEEGIFFIPVRQGREIARIPALLDSVSRGVGGLTELSVPGGRVRMVEHIMAAFSHLGLTRAEVRVSGGEELPIVDGAAEFWISALRPKMEGTTLGLPFPCVDVTEPVIYMPSAQTCVALFPPREMPAAVRRDYVHLLNLPLPLIAGHCYFAQYSEHDDGGFAQIAAQKTFTIRTHDENLTRGAFAHLFFGISGHVYNEVEWARLPGYVPAPPEDAARHKILDSVGDIALLERALKIRPRGLLVSIGSGHCDTHEFSLRFREYWHGVRPSDHQLVGAVVSLIQHENEQGRIPAGETVSLLRRIR